MGHFTKLLSAQPEVAEVSFRTTGDRASIVSTSFVLPVLHSACSKCGQSLFALFLWQGKNLLLFLVEALPSLCLPLMLLDQTFFCHICFSRRSLEV